VTGDLFRSLDDLVKDYDAKSAERLVGNMSVAEIRQALGRLQSLPPQSPLRAQLFRAWAAKEPEAAWAAALALNEKAGRSTALAAVAGEIAKTRPEAAVDLAMSLGLGTFRQYTLNSVFNEWGKQNMVGALDYLKRHPDLPVEGYTLANAIYQMAQENPVQATQQAAMLPPSNSRDYAIQSAMESWYSKDADAARRWAFEQKDPALRSAALKALVSAMAKDHPLEALAFLSQNDFNGSDEARTNLMRTWMERDPLSLLDHLAANPQDTNNSMTAYNIAYALGKATPEEQTSLLARLPETELKHNVIRQMANQEMERGRYAKAVSALNGLPDSSSRDSSLQRLGTTWASNDPQAAAAWLKLQPDSTDRDLVVGGFATSLSKTDPQAAIQWAQTIPDAAMQTTVFKNIAVRWMRSNPQAAMPWLNSLGLPHGERNNIIEAAERGSETTYSISVKDRR
jgi:hypothetical protein